MSSEPKYNQYLAESRRLAILRLLVEIKGSANDSVIQAGAEQLGFRRESRDTIREDLTLMTNAGLLKTEWFKDVMVVTITNRGVEASEGRIIVAGVKQPSIGE